MKKRLLLPVVLVALTVPCLLAQEQRTAPVIITEVEAFIAARMAELRALLAPPAPPDVTLQAGQSVQSVADTLPAGATLRLAPGAVYSERLFIGRPLTVVGNGATLQPASGVEPTVIVDACDVRVEGLRVLAAPGAAVNDLVRIGRGDAGQTTLEQQPCRVTFVGNVVLGNGTTKRGLALHGYQLSVVGNSITNIVWPGVESQAIGGWNGAGEWLIENNDLEAAGINIMVGGADPTIPGLVPTGIVIRGNRLFKRPEWVNVAAGVGVKNLLELKTGRNVLIEGNLMDGTRVEAQAGWFMQFTPSQYGTNPGNSIEHVTFRQNIVRNVSSGINLLGVGQSSVTGVTRDVRVEDNFITTNKAAFGGQGWAFQIGRSPEELIIRNNTLVLLGSNQFITVTDGTIANAVIEANAINPAGTYGIFGRANGTNYPRGTNFSIYAPGASLALNLIADANSLFRTNFPNNTYVTTPRDPITGAVIGVPFVVAEDGYVDGVVGRRRQ